MPSQQIPSQAPMRPLLAWQSGHESSTHPSRTICSFSHCHVLGLLTTYCQGHTIAAPLVAQQLAKPLAKHSKDPTPALPLAASQESLLPSQQLWQPPSQELSKMRLE